VPDSGSWLRARREELHLSRSGVERLTTDSANRTTNQAYRIRRGRLTDLEDGKSAPDIFEVVSLAECYKVTYGAVLSAFGVQLDASYNLKLDLFATPFEGNVAVDETRLVTESPEQLGIPAAVHDRLDPSRFRLGIVGAGDDTMGEVVPPGSVVVIDRSITTVEMGSWKSLYERPIYFVWHENGFSCSWCHLVRDTLFIVPYPTSRQPVSIFKLPREAEVIGRVVHVWAPMRRTRANVI
jgi:hypothetical protein